MRHSKVFAPLDKVGFIPHWCKGCCGELWLDVAHAMVGFRENEGQPDTDDLAQAQALPVAVGRKALIQQRGHLHPLNLGQQQRNIIYSFVLKGELLGHAESLPQFSKTTQENERTASDHYLETIFRSVLRTVLLFFPVSFPEERTPPDDRLPFNGSSA
jgi:hypothetical protein